MRRRPDGHRRSCTPAARAGSAALVAATLVAGATLAAAPAVAQDTSRIARVPTGGEGWNTPRALELVERARERRRQPLADSALESYRADVSGHIYFFIDREEEPEPVLLRADQVALDLYWKQGRVKQVIRGMRSEEQFPLKDFRYYLDRYTVIQNGFDDVIRVGEGRDVRNVIHPLAMQGRGLYQFRLADSTTIRLPGEPEPIRVYEIQVRPRSFDLPAIVGSLFVERARGDLVRLAFTFTPASYLDPRNERVEVMLENALWEGRWWLPREQRLLVRREIPEIDLDVGTVIRGALRVHDYEFGVELPDDFFRGSEVVMAGGPDRLDDYDFEDGLFDGLEDVGLGGAEPGTLDAVDVDAIAGRIMRERFLRGIPRVRFFAPTASDILRFGRAEGLVTGAGVAVGVGRSQAYGYGAWAWGSGEPLARVGWRPAGPDPAGRFFGEAYLNRPVELGLRPATSGVMASLAAAGIGRDYRDGFRATGGVVERRWGESRSRYRLSLRLEGHRPHEQARVHPPLDDEAAYRPVPPAASAVQLTAGWEVRQRMSLGPAAVSLRPSLEAGLVVPDPVLDPAPAGVPDSPPDTGAVFRAGLDAVARWADGARRHGVDVRLTAGLALGATAPQHQYYIGGPGTLPGHPFHAWAGTTAAVVDATAWREIVPRFVRGRAFAAAGWADGSPAGTWLGPGVPGPDPALEPWSPGPTGGVRASVGMGVALVDGILRIDYALPTDSWDGVLVLSVTPDLWSFL